MSGRVHGQHPHRGWVIPTFKYHSSPKELGRDDSLLWLSRSLRRGVNATGGGQPAEWGAVKAWEDKETARRLGRQARTAIRQQLQGHTPREGGEVPEAVEHLGRLWELLHGDVVAVRHQTRIPVLKAPQPHRHTRTMSPHEHRQCKRTAEARSGPWQHICSSKTCTHLHGFPVAASLPHERKKPHGGGPGHGT